MNNDFFYRPIWQQYLISFLLPSIVFFICYQFFIQELKQQTEMQITIYEEKKTAIKLLQSKVGRYQSAKKSSLTLLTELEFAKAIKRNQLRLTSFKYEKNELSSYWHIELRGQFINFMQFISELNDNFYYLNFQNFTIDKQDTYLQIKFNILIKRDIK